MAKIMEYDSRILTSVNKVRTAWKIVNSETRRNSHRKSGICSLHVDATNIEIQQLIADALDEHFITTAEKINISSHVNHKLVNTNDSGTGTFIYFMNQAFGKPFPGMECKCSTTTTTTTTTEETETIINSLKSKNTSGYDEMSTTVLKSCFSFISSPLNYVCTRSLSTGVFPDRLKYAIIKPSYKNGDKQDISNYRPISILTSFSNIFEKAMQSRILKKNIIS
jgi:Notch-like protein